MSRLPKFCAGPHWLRPWLGLVLGVALAGEILGGEPAARSPNIIFILTDDQGWGDGSVFGHPFMPTPHLDRLAAEGTRFEQYYAVNPVCSPSRVGFLTGQYPARWGVHAHFGLGDLNARRGMPDWLDPAAPSLARQLQAAGYATGHFGKWHLGQSADAPDPGAYGYDRHASYNANGPLLGRAAVEDYRRRHPEWKSEPHLNEDYIPHYRAYTTAWMVDEALAFAREHRDRPFYLNLWTLVPHAPLDPTAEQLAAVAHLVPQADHPAFGAWTRAYNLSVADFPAMFRIYAAAMLDLDAQVGRLMAGLRELGLRDDTIIIFTSDNGPEDHRVPNAANAAVGSPGPLRARKRSLYEGGIRVPFVVSWPGRVPAGRVDAVSVLAAVDLLPTLLTLADAPLPPAYRGDGEDQADIWLGQARDRRGPLFWEWRHGVVGRGAYEPPGLAMREGPWKLFVGPDGKGLELYHVPSDLAETENRAVEQPELVAALAAKAMAWKNELP